MGLGGRQGVQAAPNKVRFLWLTSPLAGPTWVTHEHSAKPTFQNSSPAFESSLHWTPSLWTGLSIFGSLQLARCLLNWELSSGENLLSTKMAELLRMRMLSSYLAASSRSSTKLPLCCPELWFGARLLSHWHIYGGRPIGIKDAQSFSWPNNLIRANLKSRSIIDNRLLFYPAFNEIRHHTNKTCNKSVQFQARII